jgi:hypothetical protein
MTITKIDLHTDNSFAHIDIEHQQYNTEDNFITKNNFDSCKNDEVKEMNVKFVK